MSSFAFCSWMVVERQRVRSTDGLKFPTAGGAGGGERRGETGNRAQNEAAAVHAGTLGRMAKVNSVPRVGPWATSCVNPADDPRK